MKASDLRPAGQLASRFGVKAVAYGPPGYGKTPVLNTAPRPVLCACEPGLLSMRGSNVATWEAYDVAAISEFFAWAFNSAEAKQFDTIAIDSLSQAAEIVLLECLTKRKDGRQAYGDMSRYIMDVANRLYFQQEKHVYITAKLGVVDEDGITRRRPFFPGQDLNVRIPHLFDEILYLAEANVPGVGLRPAFRTRNTPSIMARDRSGRLSEYEPLDLASIFHKCQS